MNIRWMSYDFLLNTHYLRSESGSTDSWRSDVYGARSSVDSLKWFAQEHHLDERELRDAARAERFYRRQEIKEWEEEVSGRSERQAFRPTSAPETQTTGDSDEWNYVPFPTDPRPPSVLGQPSTPENLETEQSSGSGAEQPSAGNPSTVNNTTQQHSATPSECDEEYIAAVTAEYFAAVDSG